LGTTNANDCCWLCFPFTIVIDTITFIPFGIIYITNKYC
jgi:hypothetical protein